MRTILPLKRKANATVPIVLALAAVFVLSAQAQSPVPDRILFVSDRGSEGLMHLYTMNADGSQTKRLTSTDEVQPEGIFSPDGRRIAFTVADPEKNQTDLYVMRSDGTEKKRLLASPPKAALFSPGWSPDGKQITYSLLQEQAGGPGKPSLWCMASDGTRARRLGEGLISVWSPDGSTLLFTRYTGEEKGEPALYSMDTEGAKVKRIIGSAAMGAWSPDRKRIAFMGAGNARSSDLFVCDADGTHVQQLTHLTTGQVCGPQWSRDGKQIYYTQMTPGTAGAPGGFQVYVIGADGSKSKPLTREGTLNFVGNGSALFMLMAAAPREL